MVDTLPATGEDNIIYLVPKQGAAPDTHDEYIWAANAWELIGNTQVDLSNYLTKDGDASNTIIVFTPESADPVSGSNISTIIGRIVKKYADIVSGAIVAGKAEKDKNGNDIPATYATKGEITNVQIGARNYITGLKDNWEGGIVGSDGVVALGNNYNQVTKDYQDIAFLAGKTATVSVNPNVILSGAERLKLSFRIAFYTQDFLFISYSSGDGNAPLSLTVPDDAFYCKVSVGVGIYGYVANNFDTVRFQLELGNKATDYRAAPQDIARINGEYPAMKVGHATQADTVDGLHAAAAGSVENGKLASYDPSGRLKATVLETASFLRTGSGPDTGLSFGTDSIPGTHTPYYGIFAANPSEIDLIGYGDVTSDYAILSPVAGYNTATNNNRGWMFYNPVNKVVAASLSQRGYAKFAGEVTASAFRGKADSAATADKATADGSGNNIAQTYLPKELVNTNGLYKIMRGADHMGSWLNLVRMSGNATVAQLRINVDGTMSFYNGIAGGESNIVWHAGNFNPDTKADKTQLPTITYSVSEPSNPKNGDIWIVPTD